MTPNHTLGILGLDERTTRFYLDRLMSLIGKAEINIILKEIDFESINKHLPSKYFRLKPLLHKALSTFPTCNAIIVPNMTLHETFDQLSGLEPSFPLVHPVHETVKSLLSNGVNRVSVVGSYHTTHAPYWATHLNTAGIEMLPVDEDASRAIDTFRKQVYAGEETPMMIKVFQTTLRDILHSRPIILACTELSLHTPIKESGIFDAVDIQIQAALRRFKKDT